MSDCPRLLSAIGAKPGVWLSSHHAAVQVGGSWWSSSGGSWSSDARHPWALLGPQPVVQQQVCKITQAEKWMNGTLARDLCSEVQVLLAASSRLFLCPPPEAAGPRRSQNGGTVPRHRGCRVHDGLRSSAAVSIGGDYDVYVLKIRQIMSTSLNGFAVWYCGVLLNLMYDWSSINASHHALEKSILLQSIRIGFTQNKKP